MEMNLIAGCSLLLNIFILILQAKQAAAVAELKVYMFENFVHKTKGVNHG